MTDRDRAAELAVAFLAELRDARAPWAAAFSTWARERGLSESDARAVKVAALRVRMFGAMERGAARQRARRPRAAA